MPNFVYYIIGTIVIIPIIIGLFTAIKNRNWMEALKQGKLILAEIKKLMIEAEDMKGLTGPEKKDFVLNKMNAFLKEKNINFPLDDVADLIEKFLHIVNK